MKPSLELPETLCVKFGELEPFDRSGSTKSKVKVSCSQSTHSLQKKVTSWSINYKFGFD